MASDLVHQQAAPYHMTIVHRIRPESVCPLYPSCECTNPTTALLRSWILITHRDAGLPDLLTEWRRTLVNLRTKESNCVERLGSWISIRYLTGRSRKVTNLRRHDLINIHEWSLRHSTVRNYATLPHSRSPFISGCPQHPLALWWWCAWMLLMRRCLGPNPPVTGKPERRGLEGLGSMSLSFNDRLPDHCCISCQFVCSRETEEWSAATMMQGKKNPLWALKFIACLLMLCISALIFPVTLHDIWMQHMIVLVSVSLKEVKDYVSYVVGPVGMCDTHTNITMAYLKWVFSVGQIYTCGPVHKINLPSGRLCAFALWSTVPPSWSYRSLHALVYFL